MKIAGCVFLGALLLISLVAANDPTENDLKTDGANEVGDEKYYDGGGYGGWGGYGGGGRGGGGGYGGWGGYGGGGRGGGGGYGGWGGYGGGGRGGGGGGWGGRGGGGGGGGGGGCRYGQCCKRYGGCRCCYTAQDALAYMQN